MKLSYIVENLKDGGTLIRNIASHIFEPILALMKDKRLDEWAAEEDPSRPLKTLNFKKLFAAFLKRRDAKSWASIKKLIADELINILNSKGNEQIRAEYEDFLKDIVQVLQIDDNIVISALLDIDPNLLTATPLAPIALNNSKREEFKKVAQPNGLITMAGLLKDINPTKMKDWMRLLGKDGNSMFDTIRKAFPGSYKKRF